jgi:hypothetical protein
MRLTGLGSLPGVDGSGLSTVGESVSLLPLYLSVGDGYAQDR